MDTSRISFGEMIAGVSAHRAVRVHAPALVRRVRQLRRRGHQRAAHSAWEAFGFIDILLFLVLAVALGLVVARAADAMPDLPQPPGLIIAAAGAFAVLLILFRLIVVPDGNVDVDGVDFSRKIGIFLGLIAAAGITFGGWTAMNERASGEFPEE